MKPEVTVPTTPQAPILVTGGHGMVGSYMAQFPECLVLGRAELDVTKPSSITQAIKKYQPRAIVHLAAMTNVDYAEQHPDEAYEVNAIGTYNVAKAARKHNLHLVYVSTGAVFSGQAHQPYTIESLPKPKSIYAKSKRLGELFVQDICEKYSIVRTGWVFGGIERDKKFVGMIARMIWDGETQLKAISDTFGCPTYAKDLAEALITLVEQAQYGMFHGVNKGYASRYQIARTIVKELNPQVKVKSAKNSDFPSFGAPRPRFEVIEQNLPLRSWQSALREYLRTWQDLRNQEEGVISPLLVVNKVQKSKALLNTKDQPISSAKRA